MVNRSKLAILAVSAFLVVALAPGLVFASSCGDAHCEPEEGETCDTCPADCGCLDGFLCVGGECVAECAPDCAGKWCGSDGCGGECGQCEPGLLCNAGECVPAQTCGELVVCAVGCVQATGAQCLLECLAEGSDDAQALFGALTACLVAVCGADLTLDCMMVEINGQCHDEYDACMGCQPACGDNVCGDDGCGGSCGDCAPEENCVEGQCVPACVPDCVLKSCGDDGCGGSCGECPDGEICVDTHCVLDCVPDCALSECGDDGCGGSCGECDPGHVCEGGHCIETCIPDCAGKQCGDDACGGVCGVCAPGEKCQQDQCICMADCTGKECGSDGCGGMCGLCPPNQNCQNGLCAGGGSGLGCEATGFAGCGGCQCENCVCNMDPYCCDVTWDGICADECVDMCGGCGGGNVGAGCVPTDSPGCGGCACESCVCNLDAFCCQFAWDGICVAECETDCGGCGGGPENCGDGFCDPADGETCSSCMSDCGCPPSQTCQGGACVQGGPDSCYGQCGGSTDNCYCDDACFGFGDCCADVCQACPQLTDCGGGGCGDASCDAGENCSNCPSDCPCPMGQLCQAGVCTGGGGGGCEESDFPGCGGCPCEACVCGMDPFCCDVGWDGICVDECIEQCGGCGPVIVCGDGNCDSGNGEDCATCPTDCGCPQGQACINGDCCVPNCAGKECGPDGCGGTCGHCDAGSCSDGMCSWGLGCAESQEPGCGGCTCEDCVCEFDPFCCESHWDGGCVAVCLEDCEGCDQLESCGDGVCDAEVLENCGTCPQDCGCDGSLSCVGSDCVVDFCSLGLSPEGCCLDGKLVLCVAGEVVETDCESQGGVCGWFTGNEQLDPGYYCGPEESVDVAGDPDNIYPIDCPACPSSCDGKECGGDGCGGSCGDCPDGSLCEAGECVVCEPFCDGKDCGPDGCGGNCGQCADDEDCVGGTCLGCLPYCVGAECGDDGCGGSCGECVEPGEVCSNGQCVCSPDCEDKECGSDGCGGICGVCPVELTCNGGVCSDCSPDCDGKECGDNGCGGSCGECPVEYNCDEGVCMPICLPECDGKDCGPDGCGGTCGDCPPGIPCFQGVCDPSCVPDCAASECGDDGCQGSCGECEKGFECVLGECKELCTPDCEGRECGGDGCGGSCGSCDPGLLCSLDGFCTSVAPGADLVEGAEESGGLIVDTNSSKSGGCQAGRTTSPAPLWLLVLLLSVGWALRRRRDQASCHHLTT